MQHDFNIANGSGAAVRSDLNNALEAIATSNSGATQPATTFAYQIWADTTAGLLKQRNGSNSAWIDLGKLGVAYGMGMPSGTKVLFQQTAAPTGWTKDTTHNDKALRVVSGTVGSGGSSGFTSVFGGGKVTDSHTLVTSEIPSHQHPDRHATGANGSFNISTTGAGDNCGTQNTSPTTGGFTGGGGGHDHTIGLNLAYVDCIVGVKD